jgi:long-chain acyl-CoA synthetase
MLAPAVFPSTPAKEPTMLNLSMLIEHHARMTPGREAIVSGPVRMTYGALDELACRMANGLRELGVRPGDHVALSCPNTAHFPIAYYGILKAGAAVVPLNVLLKPREIIHHLEDSDAKVYLCFEGTPDLPMGQMGLEAFEAVEACEHFVVMTKDPAAPSPIPGAPLTMGALLARQAPTFETVPRAPDDTAVILYTSGTTGRPKGAELTHANMVLNAMASRDLFADLLEPGQSTALAVLPLFHSFGQTCVMNTHLLLGNRVVLLPRFEPASVLDTMRTEGVNAFAGVPTMFWALLRYAEEQRIDLAPIARKLRTCCSGGAPIPVEILHAFDRTFDVQVLEGFGLSETSPVATFNQTSRPRKPGSVGLPIWGCEVKVVDADDVEVPRGELGEIVIRGHNIMKGYYRKPEATAEAMRGGWFHSGDIGRMDDEGYLFIADRVKDMIIRGGMNVYPREVEEVLHGHPAVSIAAVIGVPHEEHGEEVKAYVVRRPGVEVTAVELVTWSREVMAAYKYPRSVEFVDALPMTATGKVLKRELRAASAAAGSAGPAGVPGASLPTPAEAMTARA